MATWQDGPEYAPAARPDEFVPAQGVLGQEAADTGAEDGAGSQRRAQTLSAAAPAQLPRFDQPQDPVTPLEALRPAREAGRDPVMPFEVARSTMTSQTSAWGALHHDPVTDPQQRRWGPPAGVGPGHGDGFNPHQPIMVSGAAPAPAPLPGPPPAASPPPPAPHGNPPVPHGNPPGPHGNPPALHGNPPGTQGTVEWLPEQPVPQWVPAPVHADLDRRERGALMLLSVPVAYILGIFAGPVLGLFLAGAAAVVAFNSAVMDQARKLGRLLLGLVIALATVSILADQGWDVFVSMSRFIGLATSVVCGVWFVQERNAIDAERVRRSGRQP